MTGKFSTYTLTAIILMFAVTLKGGAQTADTDKQRSTLTAEAEAYYVSLIPRKDTTYTAMALRGHKNSFIKRWSIHTNMVDWLLTLPNIGLEFDLSGNTRTHWSIAVSGRINPKTNHSFSPKFVFNVNSVRGEVRKYWRTGKYGKKVYYHDEYVKLVTDRNNPAYNGDSLRGRLYNWKHKMRRNVFSGRTIENPRNWRAYYLSAWVAYNQWAINISGSGNQGRGVAAGAGFGYSIPLLPQRFPREGSLDLDLGVSIGWMVAKYDKFKYDEYSGCYVKIPESSHESWSIIPYPIVQDLHIGLVWRFRSIKNKVDLSLVDDYAKKIDDFKERQRNEAWVRDSILLLNGRIREEQEKRKAHEADSTAYWDWYHKRRLNAARILKPDTVFTGNDQMMEMKLLKGIRDPKTLKKAMNRKKAKNKKK